MGAEIGATCSVFAYDSNMSNYLKATNRAAIAAAADKVAADLRPDEGAQYDQLIEINLDDLKPLINGPHSPDRAHKTGKAVGDAARENGWPIEVSSALIGYSTRNAFILLCKKQINPQIVDKSYSRYALVAMLWSTSLIQ